MAQTTITSLFQDVNCTPEQLEEINQAVNFMIGRNTGYHLYGCDWDDIRQDATIHIIEHLYRYDPKRGNFYNFCVFVAQNRLRYLQGQYLRKHSRNAERNTCSTDMLREKLEGSEITAKHQRRESTPGPLDTIIAEEDRRRIWTFFEELKLTPLETRTVLQIAFAGSYGFSKGKVSKSIDNSLSRVKNKIHNLPPHLRGRLQQIMKTVD